MEICKECKIYRDKYYLGLERNIKELSVLLSTVQKMTNPPKDVTRYLEERILEYVKSAFTLQIQVKLDRALEEIDYLKNVLAKNEIDY